MYVYMYVCLHAHTRLLSTVGPNLYLSRAKDAYMHYSYPHPSIHTLHACMHPFIHRYVNDQSWSGMPASINDNDSLKEAVRVKLQSTLQGSFDALNGSMKQLVGQCCMFVV